VGIVGNCLTNVTNSQKGKIPLMDIVFDKRKDYPSFPGKIHPSTKREGCSTSGNIGREGIPGIFRLKNGFHFFHKCKESCNTIGNCLTI
jgi:hypothetical protein